MFRHWKQAEVGGAQTVCHLVLRQPSKHVNVIGGLRHLGQGRQRIAVPDEGQRHVKAGVDGLLMEHGEDEHSSVSIQTAMVDEVQGSLCGATLSPGDKPAQIDACGKHNHAFFAEFGELPHAAGVRSADDGTDWPLSTPSGSSSQAPGAAPQKPVHPGEEARVGRRAAIDEHPRQSFEDTGTEQVAHERPFNEDDIRGFEVGPTLDDGLRDGAAAPAGPSLDAQRKMFDALDRFRALSRPEKGDVVAVLGKSCGQAPLSGGAEVTVQVTHTGPNNSHDSTPL